VGGPPKGRDLGSMGEPEDLTSEDRKKGRESKIRFAKARIARVTDQRKEGKEEV